MQRRKLAGAGNKAGPTAQQTTDVRSFVEKKAVDPEWAGINEKDFWSRVHADWLPMGDCCREKTGR